MSWRCNSRRVEKERRWPFRSKTRWSKARSLSRRCEESRDGAAERDTGWSTGVSAKLNVVRREHKVQPTAYVKGRPHIWKLCGNTEEYHVRCTRTSCYIFQVGWRDEKTSTDDPIPVGNKEGQTRNLREHYSAKYAADATRASGILLEVVDHALPKIQPLECGYLLVHRWVTERGMGSHRKMAHTEGLAGLRNAADDERSNSNCAGVEPPNAHEQNSGGCRRI